MRAGQVHHCGTGPFERFIRDDEVVEILYAYLNGQEPPSRRENLVSQTPNPPLHSEQEQLVDLVFGRLNIKSLSTSAQVCSTWSRCAMFPPRWKQWYIKYYGLGAVKQIEETFRSLDINKPLNWCWLFRDRTVVSNWYPGCKLISCLKPKIPAFDALLFVVVNILCDPSER